MNFTEELIEKAKAAKTPEELITMAKALNIELTSEQASEYFTRLNPKSGEISDEELENVSGGACYSPDGRLVVTCGNSCEFIKCYRCGSVGYKESKWDINTGSSCKCGIVLNCTNCSHCTSEGIRWLCNEPRNNRDYRG